MVVLMCAGYILWDGKKDIWGVVLSSFLVCVFFVLEWKGKEIFENML